MDQRYRLTTLPLDTDDDDPRWREFFDAERLAFLDGLAADTTIEVWRRHAREMGMRLRSIELVEPGPALVGPVATFESGDRRVNVGGRDLLTNAITGVAVRASHRRRGLLRELVTHDLTEATNRGVPLASLTASEGSIYGRFGFGVATRHLRYEVDCRSWALRALPAGSCEYVDPRTQDDVLERLLGEIHGQTRGDHEHFSFIPDFLLGRYDWSSEAESKSVRTVAHLAVDGTVDGLASYEPVKGSDPGALCVNDVISPDPAVVVALLDFLAHVDLVEVLKVRLPWDSPVPWAITNPRALKPVGGGDHTWLRILDVKVALETRGWDADGDVVVGVIDPMGFADGTFAVSVRDGVATVTETDQPHDVLLDAETLASLYLGDLSVATLAGAGRVQGSPEALARFGRLLATDVRGFNARGF